MAGGLARVIPDAIRRRQTAKLGLLFALLILVTLAVGYGTTQFVQDEVEEQVGDQYSTLSTREADALRGWHERNIELVRSLEQANSVRQGNHTQIESYLGRQKITLSNNVQHLYYLDLANETIAASSNREETGRALSTIDAPWADLFDGTQGGGVTTTQVYRGGDVGNPNLLIGYGTPVGTEATRALVVTFWPNTYSTRLPKQQQTRSLVIDQSQRVVFDEQTVSFQPYGASNTTLAERLEDGPPSGVVQTAPADLLVREQFVGPNEPVYVGYSRVPGTDWTVLVHTPRSNAYGYVRNARLAGLGAMFVTVVLIGLVGTIISRQTSSALTRLVESVELIEAGEYDVDCSTARIDEIGRLYDSVGAMAQTLDQRQRQLERYSEYTEAIIDALEDVLVIVDAAGEVQRCNAQFAAVTGHAPDELEGMEFIEVFDEADVQAAIDTIDDGFETGSTQAELSLVTEDGETRVFEFVGVTLTDPDGDRVLAAVGRDVTERNRREAELQRTRELLAQSQRAATIGGFELAVVDGEPDAITLTDELYRIHGLTVGTPVELEQVLEQYTPEDRQRLREAMFRAIESREPYDLELQMTATDGTDRWVRAIGEPTVEAGDVTAIRGAAQDVTERRQYAAALESLNEITRGLLHTGTPPAIYELIVDAADRVIDVAGVAAYRLDSDDGTLEPAAYSAGFVDRVGTVEPIQVGSDTSPIQAAFLEATPVSIADFEDDDLAAELSDGLCLPIGDHGVFVAAADCEGVDDQTRQLLETLVATAEAAFERLDSEARIRERDEQLEAQNERLRRQNQIISLIRRIDQSLIDTGSREEIETAVCEQLAASEVVSLAWIGAAPSGDETVTPRAWAGANEGYLDSVTLAPESAEPACQTLRTESATTVANVVEGLRNESWRAEALQREFQSVISVPLEHEGYTYGVLTVYADEPEAFDELERRVFAELGETIGNAINAVETRRALYADELTELRLEITDESPFLLTVARETGAAVTFDELASQSDEATRVFFSVADVEPEAVTAVLDSLVSVTDHRVISTTEGTVTLEATVTEGVVAGLLVTHGGTPRSMTAEDGTLSVVVDVPRELDVREFVETLQQRYPSTTLAARQTVEQTVETRQELVDSLLDELTDRQREVLLTAYLSGFFEWPRENTGEEIAEMLDVSQPTVNRHIRLAQQAILKQLLEQAKRTPAVSPA